MAKRILSLLSTDAEVTVDADTFRTNDPTTIEFQKYFFDLMNDIYKNIENKKTLIVMDNLDRIETEDAMKMWATMRTFFEFESTQEKHWIKDTWLLVPYDFNGLKDYGMKKLKMKMNYLWFIHLLRRLFKLPLRHHY